MDTGDTPEEAATPESIGEAPGAPEVPTDPVVADVPASPVIPQVQIVHGYDQNTGAFR